MADKVETKGLGEKVKKDWPSLPASPETPPIDLLKPDSELHKRVKEYLLKRLKFSEEAMEAFHCRWAYNESRYQAYIDLPNYEKLLKKLADSGKPPSAIQIVVPHIFATINTITTYLIHTIAGRSPIWQIGSYKAEATAPARNMETILQYQADHTRMVARLYQAFTDGELYGLSVMRPNWTKDQALRTVWKQPTIKVGGIEIPLPGKKKATRELRTTYAGNVVDNIDPFLFFPDPRVPMSEVNTKGEFVFWRSFEGLHAIKRMEAAGALKWIDNIGTLPRTNEGDGFESNRSKISKGEASPATSTQGMSPGQAYVQLDQCTIEIIPRELGLAEAEVPEKWLFTIANKTQIVQAQRWDVDHGRHPVAVSEPYAMGYGFGEAGLADYMAPMQDLMSWFINSHMHNVRTAINNMWIVDPTKIEMQDLLKPGPGKAIRVKRAAFGQDIRTMIQQLPVSDVTRGHIKDLQDIMRMADSLSSVTDNLRGLEQAGGRKTATEVRVGIEAGASRLAAHTKRISAVQLTDLTEMMSLNTQQFLDEDLFLAVVGQDGVDNPIHLSPEHLVGDFYYPIHDGTLPLDRVAMLDVWKEILIGITGDEELRAAFSLPKIFEYVAELGGAKNIEQFKKTPEEQQQTQTQIQTQGQDQIDQGVQSGNLVPLPKSGTTPGIGGAPAQRGVGLLGT